MHKLGMALAALLLAAWLATTGEAASITYSLVGEVTAAFAGSGVSAGDAILVSVTYDTTGPLALMDSNVSQYSAVTAVSAAIGANTWTGNSGVVSIDNDAANGQDQVNFFTSVSTGPMLGGFPVAGLGLSLRDGTQTVLSDESLPQLPIPLTNFTSIFGTLTFQPPSKGIDSLISYTITDGTSSIVNAVPEPSTLLLMLGTLSGIGLVGLVRSRGRRQTRRRVPQP